MNLSAQNHRPWKTPERPWTIHMEWQNLLFLHWPVPVSVLRPLIPSSLEIDTWESVAWVGVVPFSMSNVRLGYGKNIGIGSFPELNVRTYVIADKKPGVWFFSLDATNLLTVVGARLRFGLPYFLSKMSATTRDGVIRYDSKRSFRQRRFAFHAEYYPVTEPRKAVSGSHEHWLTERYCLYSKLLSGSLARGEIHHDPWPLQDAECTIKINTMHHSIGQHTPFVSSPIVHFSKHLKVVAWSPERI